MSRSGSLWLALGVAFTLAGPLSSPTAAQQVEVVQSAVSIASGAGSPASLEMRLDDGSGHMITFESGSVLVDGTVVGSYEPGGELESEWRSFLRDEVGADADGLGERLEVWATEEAEDDSRLLRLVEKLLDLLRSDDEASVDAAVDAPEVATLAGEDLAIAPGGLAFDALSAELERLHGTLSALGDVAAAREDRLALIVHDDYTVPAGRTIAGDLALVDGKLRLGGTIAGDVLILDGTLVVEETGRVEGNVLGGGEAALELEGGAILGEFLANRLVEPTAPVLAEPLSAPTAVAVAEAPVAGRGERPRRGRSIGSRTVRNFGRAFGGVAETFTTFLCLAVLSLIAVYFARPQIEMVSDTVRSEFGRSFSMGLAGQILFIPALIMLVVFIVTIPVIPFILLAFCLASLMGYIAVAHGAGEMYAGSRYRLEWLERLRKSNSYYYVLSGLALLLLPFALTSALWVFGGLLGFLRGILAFVAAVATWILLSAGFGAVLLTRAGTRPEHAGSDDWMTAPTSTSFDDDLEIEVEAAEAEASGADDEEEGE